MHFSMESFLKYYREKAGLTQAQLAKSIGVETPQYLSNCERGVCDLSEKYFKKLSVVLKIPPQFFIDLKVRETEARMKKVMGVKK